MSSFVNKLLGYHKIQQCMLYFFLINLVISRPSRRTGYLDCFIGLKHGLEAAARQFKLLQ